MANRIAQVNTLAYVRKMKSPKLTQQDWLAAGFRALSTDGPTAIRAEALARDLKTTKGSFYWHFADLPAFKAAMLKLWREKVALEIIEEIMAEDDKHIRLELLAKNAARPAPDEFGGRSIEPAIRAWALSDPIVFAALKEMDEMRIAFVQSLLNDIGIDDPTTAELLYGAYIGLDDLASKNKANIEMAMNKLLGFILKEQ
jgi:AcrR family transcriptional regulator